MIFATLLYIKNPAGDYLLIERLKEPNKGFLSPPGGKILVADGESPAECAVREANEECGLISSVTDWKYIGLITEKAYPKIGDIMIFCYKYRGLILSLPEKSTEGHFSFVKPEDIPMSKIPDTDKLYIWKFVLRNTDNFFSIYIDCSNNEIKCRVEQE